MPLYLYVCEKCKKREEKFFTVAKYKEKILCECGNESTRTFDGQTFGIKFTNPKESKNWDDPQYRYDMLIEKAKQDRKEADEKFGKPYYPDLPDDNLPGEAFDNYIDNPEPKIVKYS